jgi:low temperature requirement protein LtrA
MSAVLLLIASTAHGPVKVLLWATAAAIDYLGTLVGRMRGWRLSPAHFVERFGQIILVALGESVVAIGVGAAGLDLTPGLISAVLLGITVVASLWWSYFDWVVYSDSDAAAPPPPSSWSRSFPLQPVYRPTVHWRSSPPSAWP